MSQEKIKEIFEYCSQIISDERVGSRFESNDVTKIWKLGDKIVSAIKPLNFSDLLPKLKQLHEEKGVRYDDRLYRAAVTFRNYWPDEKNYNETIKNLDVWTKLRELYPICDRILEGNSLFNREDVNKLISKCKDKTYTEAREEFIKFRRKGDKILLDLGIDEYEFRELFDDVSETLGKAVEEDDTKTESELRSTYTPEQFRNFRLILSALQKEDVFSKHDKDIKKITKEKLSESNYDLAKDITRLFSLIIKFINKPKARFKIRSAIPVTFIGQLSTYLRAVESEQNKIQFKKNKEILDKFIGRMSSK